jgi:hypothetical protein
VTVSTTCTIPGLALTGLTYTASKTGYVTQTGLAITDNSTTAAVTLVANATYALTVSVSGRSTTESIIVSVSGGYTCTIATTDPATTSGSCTVTVPAGSYTANATTATKQGSNTVTVSAATTVNITLS